MTDAPRFSDVEACFETARHLHGTDRSNWLATQRAAHPTLIDEVESLLAQHDRNPGWLEQPASERVSEAVQRALLLRDPRVGAPVGRYVIDALVANGGMGAVYRAHDPATPDQPVALKIVHPECATDELVARFRRESELLARLEHPHIARFLENGRTETGEPFYTMQYIDGERITDACDAQQLDVPARLELFCTVCDAVQYAHDNSIVHRDLKPSNILVDREGQPHLIDFGIAKILATEASANSASPYATRILTPEYASPEQVGGLRATPASDVYSLGVILYELLTGQAPYRFASNHPSEILSTVADPRIDAPSRSLDQGVGDGVPNYAARRRTTLPALRRQLTGDLDRILLYALRREPERRYACAGNLAADLRAHLSGRPILARPDTLYYRAARVYRRHRIAASLGCGAVFALAAGLAGTLYQARIADEQRRVALQEAENKQQMMNLMLDVFDGDELGPRPRMSAREFVRRAAERLDKHDQLNPAIRAYSYYAFGRMSQYLTDYDAATASYGKAVALQESWSNNPELTFSVLESRSKTGTAYLEAGQLDKAIHVLEAVLEDARESPFMDVAGDVATTLAVAKTQQGGPEASMSLFREALRLRIEAHGEYNSITSEAYNNLATALSYVDAFDEAERMLHKALAIDTKINHPTGKAATLHNLGAIAGAQGRWQQALDAMNQAMTIRIDVLGKEHEQVAATHYEIGRIQMAAEEFEAASASLRRAAEIQGTHRPGFWHVADTRSVLGECLMSLGRYDEARLLLEASHAQLRAALGDQHEHTAEAAQRLQQLNAIPAAAGR